MKHGKPSSLMRSVFQDTFSRFLQDEMNAHEEKFQGELPAGVLILDKRGIFDITAYSAELNHPRLLNQPSLDVCKKLLQLVSHE